MPGLSWPMAEERMKGPQEADIPPMARTPADEVLVGRTTGHSVLQGHKEGASERGPASVQSSAVTMAPL